MIRKRKCVRTFTGACLKDADRAKLEQFIQGQTNPFDEYEFSTATIVEDYAFEELFKENENLFNHETKNLVLPATVLAERCYYNMFAGCSNLTRAPQLPATMLAEQCYTNMFSRCTSLTQAPELPAMELTYHTEWRSV